MKLIVQIPCLNEADTIAQVLSDLPRTLPGITAIETLVIDDGSTDATAERALQCGATHILALEKNGGLGNAFQKGVHRALQLGADILVNTDGDNQYKGCDVEKLIAPLVQGRADIVIGCRPISSHPEFGWTKKLLQTSGSLAVRWLSNTPVRDAASGFRAYTRQTCQKLVIHSSFSHCLETVIQVGQLKLRMENVDVGINKQQRASRLCSSTPEYLWKSGKTILHAWAH